MGLGKTNRCNIYNSERAILNHIQELEERDCEANQGRKGGDEKGQ